MVTAVLPNEIRNTKLTDRGVRSRGEGGAGIEELPQGRWSQGIL